MLDEYAHLPMKIYVIVAAHSGPAQASAGAHADRVGECRGFDSGGFDDEDAPFASEESGAMPDSSPPRRPPRGADAPRHGPIEAVRLPGNSVVSRCLPFFWGDCYHVT